MRSIIGKAVDRALDRTTIPSVACVRTCGCLSAENRAMPASDEIRASSRHGANERATNTVQRPPALVGARYLHRAKRKKAL